MTKKHHIILITTIVATLASCFILAGAILQIAYHVPDGVVFENENLGGLDYSQARTKLNEIIVAMQNRNVTLRTHANEKQFTLKELGVYFDAQKTFQNLVTQTNWYDRLFHVKAAQTEAIQTEFQIDQNRLNQIVQNHLNASESQPIDATIDWNGKEWEIVSEQSGMKLKNGEKERVINVLTNSVYPLNEIPAIPVEYQIVPAKTQSVQLTEMLKKANMVSKFPVTFTINDTTITREILGTHWLIINTDKKTVTLDNQNAKKWIQSVANEFNKEPSKVTLKDVQDEESEYDKTMFKRALIDGDFEHGYEIDKEQMLAELHNAIANPEKNRKTQINLIPVESRIVSQVKGVTFPNLLSVGRSSFRLGNYPERVTNIKNSLFAFNGVIIPPDQEFSFNRITDWITPTKGYNKTKVIVAGEVVEGVGGGVCQSSTTMYRAVVNAGLKIVERSPHSLDVNYYHQYGYGIDAAVYTDSGMDLRFINDTGYPILIHTAMEGTDAIVELYGVSDGRDVELTNIPTGNYLAKKWAWNITWPNGETDERFVKSVYREPKPKVEEEAKIVAE